MYIQITIRNRDKRWPDKDIRVEENLPWERVLEILEENAVINIREDKNRIRLQSLRAGIGFSIEKSSKEAGVYTGDIIEVEIDAESKNTGYHIEAGGI